MINRIKSSPGFQRPAIDPLSDTGRNLQAVADAAAARTLEGAGDIFTPPVAGVTADAVKNIARKECEDFHDKFCPARDMRESIKAVENEVREAGLQVATFTATFTEQMKAVKESVDDVKDTMRKAVLDAAAAAGRKIALYSVIIAALVLLWNVVKDLRVTHAQAANTAQIKNAGH